MEFPIVAFDIKDGKGNYIKLEISNVYGYPNETSFRGGYDVKCYLTVRSGIYFVNSDSYFSSTGALYEFYRELSGVYEKLNGTANYKVYMPENDLTFAVEFNRDRVKIAGKFRDDPCENNSLEFELFSDQSYFAEVLRDLKKVVSLFGDNKGHRA